MGADWSTIWKAGRRPLALAQATERARLGILVTATRIAIRCALAKMATTVDNISNGRVQFGLGSAWHEYEHEVFGIPFHTVRERLERLDEAAHLMKPPWTEQRPKFDGKYYQLNEPPYNPSNVQQPHPPIVIGGGGEKKAAADGRAVRRCLQRIRNAGGSAAQIRGARNNTAATQAGTRPTTRRTYTDASLPETRTRRSSSGSCRQ